MSFLSKLNVFKRIKDLETKLELYDDVMLVLTIDNLRLKDSMPTLLEPLETQEDFDAFVARIKGHVH